MCLPLETEQAGSLGCGKPRRGGEPLPCGVGEHVFGKYRTHGIRATRPGRIPAGLGRAKRRFMVISDAACRKRSGQNPLREPGFPGKRNRSYVQQHDHAVSGEKIEKLVLDQPLVANGE